ncbi:MAG: lytic transglycosylase domain-containing protein [Terriglobia bacterium]
MAVSLLLIFSPLAKSQEQIAMAKDAQGHRVFVNANASESLVALPFVRTSSTTEAGLASSAQADEIRHTVRQESGRAKVDPALVRAIIKVESGGNSKAVSPKGAQGLMQLIPATARRFGVDNPFDPDQNIHGGVTYLRYLLKLFNGSVPLTLAAYNAGENSVIRNGGVPPFRETQNYVRRVTAIYHSPRGSNRAEQIPEKPQPPAIYRFVDANGVIHFATGDDDLPQNVQLAENGQLD